jgi:hypothetical protein
MSDYYFPVAAKMGRDKGNRASAYSLIRHRRPADSGSVALFPGV